MVRVLTKEESGAYRVKHKAEMETWWSSLSYYEKKFIYGNAKTLKQINCSHEWSDTKLYDEVLQTCHKCDLLRDIPKENFPIK